MLIFVLFLLALNEAFNRYTKPPVVKYPIAYHEPRLDVLNYVLPISSGSMGDCLSPDRNGTLVWGPCAAGEE